MIPDLIFGSCWDTGCFEFNSGMGNVRYTELDLWLRCFQVEIWEHKKFSASKHKRLVSTIGP